MKLVFYIKLETYITVSMKPDPEPFRRDDEDDNEEDAVDEDVSHIAELTAWSATPYRIYESTY